MDHSNIKQEIDYSISNLKMPMSIINFHHFMTITKVQPLQTLTDQQQVTDQVVGLFPMILLFHLVHVKVKLTNVLYSLKVMDN